MLALGPDICVLFSFFLIHPHNLMKQPPFIRVVYGIRTGNGLMVLFEIKHNSWLDLIQSSMSIMLQLDVKDAWPSLRLSCGFSVYG